MINLSQLSTFVTVIGEGSMTSAADKLYLTQPAVSQQIRNLEEELGVELLVRGTRQVKPSIQGEILYEYARRILLLTQQAENAVKSIGAQLKGNLRVGTLNSIGLHLMSPIVARLLRYNRDLHIRFDYNRADELIRSFKKGDLDILILPNLQNEYGLTLDGVERKLLLKEEMWLVASGKETEVPKEIKLEDFVKMPVVAFTGEYNRFNERLDAEIKKRGYSLEPVFESSNVGTLKRAIESGLGWGFVPSHSIRKQVRSGRMNRIFLEDFEYTIELNYYFRREVTSMAEVFYQALENQEKTGE